MTMSTTPLLAALVAAIVSVGCVLLPGTARPVSAESLRHDPDWMLLDSVPAVRQVSDDGCGAACLAMVLAHWGIPATAAELERECIVPGTEGILASCLLDAAKNRGLSAYLFAGTAADLEHELGRGRPVIVGLAKPRGDERVRTHFQVVVGWNPTDQRIAVLEPAVGHLMADSLAEFEAEWIPTHRVMLVIFQAEAETTSALPQVPTPGVVL